VLSGKIKVNFPGRMAFKVTSAVDSKVILHKKGAEGLLGRGDMLYLSPTRSTTIRIHAPWVPLQDVKVIADKLREIEAKRLEDERKKREEAEAARLAEYRKKQGTSGTGMEPATFAPSRTLKQGESENIEINFGWTTPPGAAPKNLSVTREKPMSEGWASVTPTVKK